MWPFPLIPTSGISSAVSTAASIVKSGVTRLTSIIRTAWKNLVSQGIKDLIGKLRDLLGGIKEKFLGIIRKIAGVMGKIYDWMKRHKGEVVFALQTLGLLLMMARHPFAIAVGAAMIISAGVISGDVKGAIFLIGLGLLGLSNVSMILKFTKLAKILKYVGRGMMFLSSIPFIRSAMDRLKARDLKGFLSNLSMGIIGLAEGPFPIWARGLMNMIAGISFIGIGGDDIKEGFKKIKEGKFHEGLGRIALGIMDVIFGFLMAIIGLKRFKFGRKDHIKAEDDLNELYRGNKKRDNGVAERGAGKNEKGNGKRNMQKYDKRSEGGEGKSTKGVKRHKAPSVEESEEFMLRILKKKYGKRAVIVENVETVVEFLKNPKDNRILILRSEKLRRNFRKIDGLVFKWEKGKLVIDAYQLKTREAPLERMDTEILGEFKKAAGDIQPRNPEVILDSIINTIKKGKHKEIGYILEKLKMEGRLRYREGVLIIFDGSEPIDELSGNLKNKYKIIEEIKGKRGRKVIVYVVYIEKPVGVPYRERGKNSKWIKEKINAVKEWIKDKVRKAYDFVKRGITKVYNWIKDKVRKLTDAIKRGFNKIKEKVGRGLRKAKKSIREGLKKVKNLIKEKLKKIKTIIKRNVKRARIWLKKKWNGIKSTVRNGINRFKNLLRRIGGRIKNFVRNGRRWIRKTSRNFRIGWKPKASYYLNGGRKVRRRFIIRRSRRITKRLSKKRRSYRRIRRVSKRIFRRYSRKRFVRRSSGRYRRVRYRRWSRYRGIRKSTRRARRWYRYRRYYRRSYRRYRRYYRRYRSYRPRRYYRRYYRRSYRRYTRRYYRRSYRRYYRSYRRYYRRWYRR